MINRRNGSARFGRYTQESDEANPLEFVANISDVMLVLAVALMCALIAHWGLNFKDTVALDQSKLEPVDVELTEEEMQQTSQDGERKYQKMGTVFQDVTTGDMYVVRK